MRKHYVVSCCLGLVLAAFATLAGARPLLLPPAQQLLFPSPGEPQYQHQLDPLVYSVAIDGNTALVEAERAIDAANNRSYGVFVFERGATGHWDYRGPLIEGVARTNADPLIEGNVAVLNRTSATSFTVYERGTAGWAQSAVIQLPGYGYAARLVDGAIYVQSYDPFGQVCTAPLRQYRRVAGVWTPTASIGPEQCNYSRFDVNQGRLVIGYTDPPDPTTPPLQIYADDGSANWPRVATPTPPARTWPFMYAPYAALNGNSMYVDMGHVYRNNSGNQWTHTGTFIEPEIETNLSGSTNLGPMYRGNYLLLAGQEHDYEPPVLQDSGYDGTYTWETLRVYRKRSDGGFDYYAKLNPEFAVGTYGVSADGRRIIASSSYNNFDIGDYPTVFVFEVPDSVSFPGALQDDFESGGAGRWTPNSGSFAAATAGSTHVLRQSSVAGESGATYTNVDWTDQAIEADIRPTQFSGPDRWFGLVTRRTDAQNYYYVTFRSTGAIAIKRMRDGVFTTLLEYGVSGDFVPGRNYHVRFEAVGDQLAVFLNGKGLKHVKDSTLTHGHPGVAGYKTSYDVDNVVLTSGTRTLLRADGPIGSWTYVPPTNRTGTWNYVELPDHQLGYSQLSTAGDGRWVSRVPIGNQVVSARIRPVSFGTSTSGLDQWVGIAARYVDDSNYYYLTLRNSNRVSLRKLVNGAIQELGSAPVSVAAGKWYDLRLEVIGSRLRAFVNGELKVELTDANAHASGRNAMIMYKAAADYTDYFAYQP